MSECENDVEWNHRKKQQKKVWINANHICFSHWFLLLIMGSCSFIASRLLILTYQPWTIKSILLEPFFLFANIEVYLCRKKIWEKLHKSLETIWHNFTTQMTQIQHKTLWQNWIFYCLLYLKLKTNNKTKSMHEWILILSVNNSIWVHSKINTL